MSCIKPCLTAQTFKEAKDNDILSAPLRCAPANPTENSRQQMLLSCADCKRADVQHLLDISTCCCDIQIIWRNAGNTCCISLIATSYRDLRVALTPYPSISSVPPVDLSHAANISAQVALILGIGGAIALSLGSEKSNDCSFAISAAITGRYRSYAAPIAPKSADVGVIPSDVSIGAANIPNSAAGMDASPCVRRFFSRVSSINPTSGCISCWCSTLARSCSRISPAIPATSRFDSCVCPDTAVISPDVAGVMANAWASALFSRPSTSE